MLATALAAVLVVTLAVAAVLAAVLAPRVSFAAWHCTASVLVGRTEQS
jgi:hypothetical protein